MIKEILDVRTGKREQVGGSGGSTELKLVAIGTCDENRSNATFRFFTLDNSVENNRLYFCEYWNENVGYFYSFILTTNALASINIEDENAEPLSLNVELSVSSIMVFSNDININIPYNNNDTIKIYELPYTLGGAE